MKTVSVKRDELLAQLRTNRDNHRNLFLKAQDGFRKRVIEELDSMLADARDGKPVRTRVQLQEPQDHTDDYDNVIAMLSMSVDDVVCIEAQAFANYVMDDWTWSNFAHITNTTYASGGKIDRL